MRLQRLSYRYAVVVSAGRPRPFGQTFPGDRLGGRLAQPCWQPPADLFETDEAVVVTVELAGIDQEELDVVLFEDALVVSGERRLPPAGSGGIYHVADVRQGPFRLELALPAAVTPERVDARYDQGFLQITLAKAKAR